MEKRIFAAVLVSIGLLWLWAALAPKLFPELAAPPADLVVSDCTLAGLQIAQGTGRRVAHPIEVIREAYGLTDPK